MGARAASDAAVPEGRVRTICVRYVCAALALLVVLAGCTSQTKTVDASPSPTPGGRQQRQPSGGRPSVIDPCADQLHSLAGPILMHYVLHRRLPASLDEIAAIAGPDPAIGFTCPVSKGTYVYDPAGFELRDRPGRVVLYDPRPVHNSGRWAITVQEQGRGQALITDVILIAESQIPRRPVTPSTRPAAAVQE